MPTRRRLPARPRPARAPANSTAQLFLVDDDTRAETALTPGDQPDPLADEVRRLRQAQRISKVGSWHYELESQQLVVSDALLELHGMLQSDFDGTYGSLKQRVHPEDRGPLTEAMVSLGTTLQPMTMRYRVIRSSDGAPRWFDARGVVEYDKSGRPTHLAGTVADVTDLVDTEVEALRAHDELIQAHSYQQAVITATPDAIHIYDVSTKALTRANRTNRPLIGFTDELARVLRGADVDQLVPHNDVLKLEAAFADTEQLPDGEVAAMRHRVQHGSGDVRWVSRRMTPFERDAEGHVTLILVISRDVTDVVQMEQRLEHAALHDEMTGLPNRRLIRDRLEQSLRRAARGGHIAVLICDLDGFKRINDSQGHRTGDEVLVQAAQRLVDATRTGDTVARMGGDEFAVVLDIPQDEDPAALAERVASRIAALVAKPIKAGGVEHTLSVSIGICLNDDDSTAESMLSDADTAMYHVKAHGANGQAFFQPMQRPDIAGRDHIERQIRRALAEDLVEVYYQPIVEPRTNLLHSVEALVRICDDDGSFLNTAVVVDVAEHTGLIAALDERVLKMACAQMALWRALPELKDLQLKVNRSVKDITKPGFYARISEALRISGLDPRALTLEITETVLLDATEDNLADLRALNEVGIGLAIDDFGTGYASLRYLAELPITCIKIDRSFTSKLPFDPTSITLVRATIGLAEQLGINCIVEGVETMRQLNALPNYDRLLIQGYLYARPQSPRDPLAARIAPGEAHSIPAAPAATSVSAASGVPASASAWDRAPAPVTARLDHH